MTRHINRQFLPSTGVLKEGSYRHLTEPRGIFRDIVDNIHMQTLTSLTVFRRELGGDLGLHVPITEDYLAIIKQAEKYNDIFFDSINITNGLDHGNIIFPLDQESKSKLRELYPIIIFLGSHAYPESEFRSKLEEVFQSDIDEPYKLTIEYRRNMHTGRYHIISIGLSFE